MYVTIAILCGRGLNRNSTHLKRQVEDGATMGISISLFRKVMIDESAIRQCAAEQVDYSRYLLRLTELENARSRPVSHQTQHPLGQIAGGQFRFPGHPLNKSHDPELARCEFGSRTSIDSIHPGNHTVMFGEPNSDLSFQSRGECSGNQFGKQLDESISEAWKHNSKVLADWDVEPALALNDQKDGGDLWPCFLAS